MLQRTRRGLGLLLVTTLVAVGCSGGDEEPISAAEQSVGKAEEISTEIDRSGRFTSLERFCSAGQGGEEGAAPEDVEPGISAEEIVVTHVRVRLEELAGLGFAVDVGDQVEQFEAFVRLLNEECGGIHGRSIRLELVETPGVPGSDPMGDARSQCIRITEDLDSVFAVSVSGFGGFGGSQCLTIEHDAIFVSTALSTDEVFARADGRLISVQLTPTTSMRAMVHHVFERGLLDGKTVGVVGQDSAGEPENVQRGIIDTLEGLGVEVARHEVLGCGGGNICRDGVVQAVQGMIDDGVDVLFPAMNVISFAGFMGELVTQGVQPGDIAFYNSNHFNQAGDLASGKILEFAGEKAAALYDGTVITDSAPTGDWRLAGTRPAPFDEMCNAAYTAASRSGTSYRRDVENESKYGSVTTACSIMRMVARAIEAAGPNPTRADLAAAMRRLGPVDLQRSVPGSIVPGKYAAPDVVFPLEYRYPCDADTPTEGASCITPTGGPIPIAQLTGS